jgi:2-(1,2-epoxy-1,2-dihydrophenyl)acetyl-CoA isomerase
MSSILFSIQDNVAIIRFNRSDKFNSFNREMAFTFQKSLDDCAANDTIRAVLITGEGKAFCAGQDLSEAIDPSGVGIQRIVSEQYNPIITRIRNLEKPVIAAVNGVAAGAGANIAFACDIVVASSNASFIQAFSKIGLVPDSGGTFFLPRLVGFQKAMALMMLGDKVTAQQALDLGMIYSTFDADKFETEAIALATKLSLMPTKGLALTKKLLNDSLNNTLEEQLKLEEIYQAEAGGTFDYKEGVNAFLEKRIPIFKGK